MNLVGVCCSQRGAFSLEAAISDRCLIRLFGACRFFWGGGSTSHLEATIPNTICFLPRRVSPSLGEGGGPSYPEATLFSLLSSLFYSLLASLFIFSLTSSLL